MISRLTMGSWRRSAQLSANLDRTGHGLEVGRIGERAGIDLHWIGRGGSRDAQATGCGCTTRHQSP